MFSWCEWGLRGMPLDPLEAHACGDHGHGYAGPKTAFLVDLAGISETVSELLPRFYEFVDGT